MTCIGRRYFSRVLLMLLILTLNGFGNYLFNSLLMKLYGKNSVTMSSYVLNTNDEESLRLKRGALSLRYLDLLFIKAIKEQRQAQLNSGLKNTSYTDRSITYPPTCPSNLFLLILVPIRRKSFTARQAIRTSWGNSSNELNQLYLTSLDSSRHRAFSWKTIFVVGSSQSTEYEDTNLLAEESRWHKDILEFKECPEGYRAIQKKVMLSLSWASTWCESIFVLKTDDDVFVNIHRVLPWIEHLVDKKILYAGSVNYDSEVIRDWNHPNFLSFEDHPEPIYKPYCSGGGYFLAGNFLKNLTQAAKSVRPIANEDAYIGMVTDFLGVKPYDESRILPYLQVSLDDFLGSHGVCVWIDQFLMHGVRGKSHVIMHWNAVTALSTRTLCLFHKRKAAFKKRVQVMSLDQTAP